MMPLSIKIGIYFLIIASEIDYLWSRPIDLKLTRKKRQVVQPKWLTVPDSPSVDPGVRITNQNLKEAAAIREAIQKAIDSGTFAVDFDQPKAPKPTEERSKPTAERSKPTGERPNSTPAKQVFPKFEMPELEIPKFDLPQFNFSDFGLPEINFSEFDPAEFFTTEERDSFLQQLNRLWQMFWKNSKTFFSSLN